VLRFTSDGLNNPATGGRPVLPTVYRGHAAVDTSVDRKCEVELQRRRGWLVCGLWRPRDEDLSCQNYTFARLSLITDGGPRNCWRHRGDRFIAAQDPEAACESARRYGPTAGGVASRDKVSPDLVRDLTLWYTELHAGC